MRQDLIWYPNDRDDEFTSLNTRKSKDEIGPGELQSISNYTFDELGGIKKIKGNALVSSSVVTANTSQPADSIMVDCYWDSTGTVQDNGDLKSDVIGLKFPDAFFSGLSGTALSAELYLTTVTADTFEGIAYLNTADFTEATASPPTYSTTTSVDIIGGGVASEHVFSLPVTWITSMVSNNYGMQIRGASQSGYFYSSLGGVAYPTEVISYWKLDEASGNAIDALTNYNLTENGTVPSDTGKLSDCRGEFSTSNYFAWGAGGSSATVFDKDLFMVEGWFKISTSGADQVIFSKSSDDGISTWVSGWNLKINNADKLEFTRWGSATLTSTATYTDGNWHYFFVGCRATSGANEVRMYIDGVVDQQTTGTAMTPYTTDLRMGLLSANTLQPFQGLIDDCAFWDMSSSTKTWADLEAYIFNRYNNGDGRVYV